MDWARTAKDSSNVEWQQSLGFVAYRIGDTLLAQHKFEAAVGRNRRTYCFSAATRSGARSSSNCAGSLTC